MWFSCSLCLVFAFTVSTYGQNEGRRPPSVTRGPERNIIFRANQAVTLTCRAEGIPAVTYEWKKNGDVLSLNNVDFSGISDGDITIRAATQTDAGFYQCFAKNTYGKALSAVAHLQRAFLDEASTIAIVNLQVQEGRPFFIPAARRLGYPTPTYDWDIVASTVDAEPRKYQQSQRVRSACNGDLYFAYALKSADELSGRIYKSTVFNANIDVRSGGSYTRVIVTPGPSPDFPPNITYFSKSQEVALIGGWIELKCFFSGKPEPTTLTWSKPPRHNLPQGRNSISHFGTTLNISNIIDSDEGVYVCTATNSEGTSRHSHNITVEAVPIFKQESDGPHDVNVTESDTVTFNCSAFAKPEATVVWLWNGQPIEAKEAPKRFAFSSDMKSLTVRDVCRDCDDQERQTDLMVIQCNASNVHGYAFASGYLNVLLRTKVTLQSSSTFVSVDLTKENLLQFNCSATSDPSTPVTVRWRKVLDQGGEESVYNELPYLSVVNGTLTLRTEPNCSDTCYKYLGEYKCVADNGYTQDSVTVMLNSSTTEQTEKPPLPKPLNWIVIGIAIGLFLLLLILTCCIVFQLTKGDEYDVDGKERKSGKIPEEEILANDFQDYYPSECVKRKGSGASLGSTVMFKSMDDIRECDDDIQNFGEDGSFVGKYSEKPLYE